VVISGGFRETRQSGSDLQEKLNGIAGHYHMGFLGSNCVGFINSRLPLNITVDPPKPLGGHLAIITQSRTLIGQTPYYRKQKRIHLSKAISLGNEANGKPPREF